MNRRGPSRITTIMFVAALALGCSTAPLTSPPAQASSAVHTPIVLIVMENQGYPSIVGNLNSPFINASGPFGCGGANPGLLCGIQFSNFRNPQPSGIGSDGNSYPSLPAYVELTSADLSGFTAANCPVAGLTTGSSADSCFKDVTKKNVMPASNPQENLFHQLDTSGLPSAWGAFAEQMGGSKPTNCRLHDNVVAAGTTGGSYATRHFPVVYYGDVTGSCATKAAPYVMGSAPDPNNLPQFSFFAPDTCSDMHNSTGCTIPTAPTDCTGKTGSALQICIGDDWLANNVPPLLSKALVIVTWDEDHRERGNKNRVLLVMDGVGVAAQSNNATAFTFDGLLHGLEDYWSLPCISGDGISLYGHTPGSCGATSVPFPVST